MSLLFTSNKVMVSCTEANNDVEAQAFWPPIGYMSESIKVD